MILTNEEARIRLEESPLKKFLEMEEEKLKKIEIKGMEKEESEIHYFKGIPIEYK